MNNLLQFARRTRFYLLALACALLLLNILSFTGCSALGSASADTFSPGGPGTHSANRFYHK